MGTIQKILASLTKLHDDKKGLIDIRYEEHSMWLANELELLRKLINKNQNDSCTFQSNDKQSHEVQDNADSNDKQFQRQKRKSPEISQNPIKFSPELKKSSSMESSKIDEISLNIADINKLRKDQLLEELEKRNIKAFTMKALKKQLVDALESAILQEKQVINDSHSELPIQESQINDIQPSTSTEGEYPQNRKFSSMADLRVFASSPQLKSEQYSEDSMKQNLETEFEARQKRRESQNQIEQESASIVETSINNSPVKVLAERLSKQSNRSSGSVDVSNTWMDVSSPVRLSSHATILSEPSTPDEVVVSTSLKSVCTDENTFSTTTVVDIDSENENSNSLIDNPIPVINSDIMLHEVSKQNVESDLEHVSTKQEAEISNLEIEKSTKTSNQFEVSTSTSTSTLINNVKATVSMINANTTKKVSSNPITTSTSNQASKPNYIIALEKAKQLKAAEDLKLQQKKQLQASSKSISNAITPSGVPTIVKTSTSNSLQSNISKPTMTQASSVSKQISSSISSTVPIKTTATIAGGALKQSNSGSSQLSNVPTVVAKKGPVAPVFGSKKPTTVALTEVKATLETSPTVMPFSLPTESSQQTSKELDHENTPLTDSISITTTVSTDTISTNDQVKLKSVLSNPPIRIGHVSSPEVEAHIDPPLVVNVPATAANFSPAKLSPNKISPIKSPQAERQYELDDESDSGTDDDDEAEDKEKKFIPDWARGIPLKEALQRQLGLDGAPPVDPDLIFYEVTSCNLEEIFGSKGSNDRPYGRRTSSGKWDADTLTLVEKRTYRSQMGY